MYHRYNKTQGGQEKLAVGAAVAAACAGLLCLVFAAGGSAGNEAGDERRRHRPTSMCPDVDRRDVDDHLAMWTQTMER